MSPDPPTSTYVFRSLNDNASKVLCVRLLRAFRSTLGLNDACAIFDGLKAGTATLSASLTYFERVAFESLGFSQCHPAGAAITPFYL